MRSRYCAYALGNVAYVMATTLEEGRAHVSDNKAWARQLGEFCRSTDFDALVVTHQRQAEREAWVSFIARLRRGGGDASFAEKSHFVRQGELWLYEGGEPRPIL